MKKRATAATGVVGVTEMLHTSVLSRLVRLCSGTGVVPTIGMLTHSQQPRKDRPRHHKGIDVSHPRCIMVSSRKHHRSVLRYRPDRGRDHVVGADPSQGMAGRVREPRRWWLGVGPPEGSGPAFFAFSGPPGPARCHGRHVPGIYDESRDQDTRRCPECEHHHRSGRSTDLRRCAPG